MGYKGAIPIPEGMVTDKMKEELLGPRMWIEPEHDHFYYGNDPRLFKFIHRENGPKHIIDDALREKLKELNEKYITNRKQDLQDGAVLTDVQKAELAFIDETDPMLKIEKWREFNRLSVIAHRNSQPVYENKSESESENNVINLEKPRGLDKLQMTRIQGELAKMNIPGDKIKLYKLIMHKCINDNPFTNHNACIEWCLTEVRHGRWISKSST